MKKQKKKANWRTKKKIDRSIHVEAPRQSVLRFTPYAWAKLLFIRDCGPTEVGGYGITADDDLLLVSDFALVKQSCSWASVKFDDASVADFFDDQIDCGRPLEQFSRIWIHTHPGDCPFPSTVDEETFERVFGKCDWAVMAIVAKGSQSYARLTFSVGPGGSIEIPIEVDYCHPFDGTQYQLWQSGYDENVVAEKAMRFSFGNAPAIQFDEPFDPGQSNWDNPWDHALGYGDQYYDNQ